MATDVEMSKNVVLLDHEKLVVYQISLEFVMFAEEVVELFPKGRRYLSDQLQRAALSISLNIAEGAGEFAINEKARFYRIAKRSATECASVLDICRKLELLNEVRHLRGREIIIDIVSILVKMIQREG